MMTRGVETGMFCGLFRWAWLSRGMAGLEEMKDVAPDAISLDGLKEEMSQCEAEINQDVSMHASVDELLEKPDVDRTTFLWQIEGAMCEEDAHDWEKEDSSWHCLPNHWQQILNARLAEHQSKVQDAEAFWMHRRHTYGDSDVKTKNALKKFQSIEAGEGSVSVVLISKSTGKEMSPKIYQRCVSTKNGELQVSVSSQVTAFKLNIKDLKLEELLDPPVSRSLRVVSVTGRSREIQEIRLHLNLVSLNKSHVLHASCGAPSAAASASFASAPKQDDISPALALMDQDDLDGEAAEDGMVTEDAPMCAMPEMEQVTLTKI